MESVSSNADDDDGVRLIGFSLTGQNHQHHNADPNSGNGNNKGKKQFHRRTKSCLPEQHPSHFLNVSPGLTITANGRVSPRRQDSLPTPLSEKVKLVKFEFNEEDRVPRFFHEAYYSEMENGCPNGDRGGLGGGLGGGKLNGINGGGGGGDRTQEREERMERLKKESQDWFSKVREENHKWRRGYSPSSTFADPEDRVQKFFEEAQKKFSMGNQEIFARFMQDNRERFADILEDQNRLFQIPPEDVKQRASDDESRYQGPKRPNSLSSEFSGTSASDESCINEKNANRSGGGYSVYGGGRSTPKFPKRSPTSPGDFSPGYRDNKRDNERAKDNTRITANSTNFLSSPVRVGPNRMAATHYHMSKSTFEYCGLSNSYRFHTEQITRNYEHGYESISESEDEEDDECESVEDATSTLGTASELDEESISAQEFDARSDSGCLLAAEYESKKDKVQQTLHKIATELLTTERTYVSILHLLDQVFAFRVDQENRVHNMFSQDTVAQMFCNLKSLYKLHHDFLLPLLEERLAKWDSEPRIGDIMKNFAPFLKMYTEYVKNYDNAMGLINALYQKQPHFAQIMDDIHTLEECGHLTLQHHMLTPVQRVPRYQLLLKDYLKKLPDHSPDRADTEKALELVSTAAIHANEAMKKNDKIKKLLEIQEMIGGVVDLVSPSRELLKEGKIIKISARSGDHQERHLFLFNDLLLLCSQRRIANRVVSGPIFRVRARLEVEGLTVEEGDNLETANSFYIKHVGRSVELYTHTIEEKQGWMEAFAKAVHELTKRKSSLKSPEGLELGKRAPTFVKVESVTHCMSCGRHFNAFSFKWKHHCHACGIVACGKCLVRKLPLPCEKYRSCRVCNSCYEALVTMNGDDSTLKYAGSPAMTPDSPPPTFGSPESPVRHRSVLDVKPLDLSVVCGYLQLKARSRTWIRRWFALHVDFVLYSFASEHEERALTSMPVPGYVVNIPSKGESGLDGRDNVFKLSHQKKVYFFQAQDSVELERWVSALQMASRAESPS